MFNLIFGYYDRYAETFSATSTGTGWTVALGTEVPPGEVWVITVACAHHDSTSATELEIGSRINSTDYPLNQKLSVATWERLLGVGTVILKAGDRAVAGAYNLTSGKTVYGQVLGYKMKVSQ